MQKNLSFMSNKKQNEELQSRREFFKKAAKAALPVVGAVVMASLPNVMQAATGCHSTCMGYCVPFILMPTDNKRTVLLRAKLPRRSAFKFPAPRGYTHFFRQSHGNVILCLIL